MSANGQKRLSTPSPSPPHTETIHTTETMVPAAAITLATHAIGNAILLHYIFSPLLEHDSVVMVSLSTMNESDSDTILFFANKLIENLLNLYLLTVTSGPQRYHRD